ncbi:uncharacterized protein PAC_13202 [Phialocephala subalpina]|uniref:Uncharacterized protein n=1 Tax=Phialocephala subalpina TaxID=576137 RepID=A0A1L7XE46_9HELO|nr:uncharacterized protein PAC_13202 [Phialocephala subalpina]
MLDDDQRALYNNYSLSATDRVAIKTRLEATFNLMVTSAKELFVEANECKKCGDPPYGMSTRPTRFNHAMLDDDQRALYNNYSLSATDRVAIKTRLEATFNLMVTSAKELFVEANECKKCGDPVLKIGSRHEHLPATQALWDEYETQVNALVANILIVNQEHLNDLKMLFDAAMKSAKADNISAGCTANRSS